MNQKKYVMIGFLLIVVTCMPLASAQGSLAPAQNHMLFANIQMTGYNATALPLGLLFKDHQGLCIYMRVWTSIDGYINISKNNDPSSSIVLYGNQTITMLGFFGYAVMGGNCSSGHCDPMNVHGKVLRVTW